MSGQLRRRREGRSGSSSCPGEPLTNGRDQRTQHPRKTVVTIATAGLDHPRAHRSTPRSSAPVHTHFSPWPRFGTRVIFDQRRNTSRCPPVKGEPWFFRATSGRAVPDGTVSSRRRRGGAVLAGAIMATGGLSAVAPAATAAEERGGATHSVTVLNGAENGGQESTVRSRTCFTGRDAADRAERAVPAAATELMIWSEHRDWGGVYDRIYGYDGPCDSSDYTFSPSTRGNHRHASAAFRTRVPHGCLCLLGRRHRRRHRRARPGPGGTGGTP